MKKIHLRFLLFAFWVYLSSTLFSLAAYGQSPENIIFRNITPDDGLPVTSVTDVTQDSFGYIWIGSWVGVYRYDGQTFEKKSPEGRYLEADNKGGVWISYSRGGPHAYYNSVQDSLHIYEIESNVDFYPRIDLDAAGRVWTESENGLLHFNESLQRFEPDSTQEPGSSFNVIAHADSSISYYYRKSEDEWGLAHRTVDGYHTFEYAPFDQNNPEPTLRADAVTVRFKPYKENGLLFVNEFGWATRENKNENWQFIKSPDPNLLRNISDVIVHKTDEMWVHKTNSLIKVDIKTGEFKTYLHNALNQKSLLGFNQVFAGSRLFIDHQDVLWIPSFASGISRLNLFESDFGLLKNDDGTPLLDVISAFELEDGSFMIGARLFENSLFHFDSGANVIKRYTGRFDSPAGRSVSSELSHPFVWSLAKGSDGSIWAGTGSPGPNAGGLNRIRPGSNEITRFKHDPDDEASLYPGNWISNIIEDGSGRIWFQDFNSMGWVDPKTEIITRYSHPENSGISDGENFNVLETKSGNLIVSSENNRYYLIHHEDLSIEMIDLNVERDARTSIYIQDFNDRFWVTSFDGFGRLDSSLTKIEKWYDIDVYDFPISDFSSFKFDEQGNVWLGTDNGIVKFDPDTEKVTHYPYQRGLQGYKFEGRVNYQGPSGKIYFGDTGGVNIFDPSEITENPHPPEMVFTNLSLDGNQIQFGAAQPIETPIEIADVIVVQPDILSVSIEFGAMHFAANESNQYQYQLVGFDDDWRDGGTLGQATYTNLPPGDYTFRIKGSNLDGVWSDGLTSIQMAVLPPWYQTWWAYGFYFILFVAGILVADSVQRRRVQQKEREKAREKELEQAREIEKAYHNLEIAHENLKSAQEQLVQQEKLASLGQLTAGIAHEIKNPLNFVNNFSDLSAELIEEARDEIESIRAYRDTPLPADALDEMSAILNDVEMNLKKIYEHGTRADGIVKSMLQHSRGGSGKMEATNINALIKEYSNLAFHGMRAGKDPINVDIELDLDKNVGEVEMITEDFSRVILN
ncbi:triple tyrosine motif-containing protein, partial [Rhodohalobacter sulfatireducens]|uniref:triple tyrosine motif-containing protein n=1 Tax=Rhodohalobacter sulfatireducens TaxID=2911366 RepID=UPI00272CDDCA